MDKASFERTSALRSERTDDRSMIDSIRKAEQSKSLDQLFDLSFDLMCMMDLDGNFTRISHSFTQLLGYGAEEFLYHPLSNFIIDRDKVAAAEAILQLRKEAPHAQFEGRCYSKDGRLLWLSWRIIRLPDQRLAFAIARDVTTQKESVERLKNFSAQLHDYQQEYKQSLRYASLLQGAIMPDPASLRQFFPESFIFYQPKHIVSGDFFWFDNAGDKLFIAAADCTGHGVPGALLSILGINTLHSGLHSGNIETTSALLKHLDVTFDRYLGRKFGVKTMSDGMDISICAIDRKEGLLHFSGANSPVYVVRNQELIRLDPSRYFLGSNHPDFDPETRTMALCEDDMIYLLSDGYPDQFGGEENRKFSTRRLKELFVLLADQPAEVQEAEFISTWRKWKGREEQTDDILLMGIRI